MTTYGYSLWAVFTPPKRITNLLKRYNLFPHVPHITVKTNISTLPEAKILLSTYRTWDDIATVKGQAQIFTKSYENDPLAAWGFPATLNHTKIDHSPHLSIHYNTDKIKYCPNYFINFTVPVQLRVADLTSPEPSDWRIVL